MKKRIRILLVLMMVLALGLAACGLDDEEPVPLGPAEAAAGEEISAEPTAAEELDEEEFDEEEFEEEPAEPSGAEEPGASGQVLADSGFRPDVHGFSFENYGEGYTNLTPEEMHRVFGDDVCAAMRDGECILTPPAAQWMEQENGGMSGGHCYGFSVASLRFFQNLADPSEFGGQTAAEIPLEGNEAVQREIAYSFIFQGFDPVWANAIGGTPNAVLDRLIEVLNDGSETYTLGFFNAQGEGGHAVTPFAVEDRGDGILAVLLYDNNWPGMTREMIFDRNADRWTYNASINPDEPESEYWGDATTQSLFLFPTTPGLEQQPCWFCAEAATASLAGRTGLASPIEPYYEIWLDGEGDLLITDEEDRKLGYDNGKLVNEIPGAKYDLVMSGNLWSQDREPVYRVPRGTDFNMTIDGSRLEEETLTDVMVFGPGYVVGIEGIMLQPGQQDDLTILPEDGMLSYQTEASVSPNIVLGVEREDADFYFEVQGVSMEGGGAINALLDVKEGYLVLTPSDMQAEGTFSLYLTRIDEETEETFYGDDIVLPSDAAIYVFYDEWKGEGTELLIGFDEDGDGEPEEVFSSLDEG